MALDVGDALERGYRRTTARNGLLLLAITYVLNVLNGAVGPEAASFEAVPGTVIEINPNPLVAVPWAVDSLVSLTVLVGGLLVTLAALRTFVGENTETLPESAFTRNAGSALLNLFIGGIVFVIAVGIGLVLLVVPGVFLLVTLVFWDVFVAVEDRTFMEGFRRSWQLTDGHRWTLFVLGVAYILAALGVSIVFSLLSFPFGEYGLFVGALGNAATTVYAYAVLASAYVQLTADEPGANSTADEPDAESSESDRDGDTAAA